MASTFELDVSMALDDLAWHFVNHHDLDYYEETLQGLRELEATEAAGIFENAFAIIEPHRDELGLVADAGDSGSIHAWLETKGIQKLIDPLNDQMWALLKQWRDGGLMHYWTAYARKYPERCVATD